MVIDQILTTIHAYIDGSFRGDSTLLSSAFADGAVMKGYIGDRFISVDANEYASAFNSEMSMEKMHVPYQVEVEDVRVYGHTASVTIRELNFENEFHFITQFQLILNADSGAWEIVSKAFETV